MIGRLPRAGTVSCAEGPPSAALIEGLITLTGSIDGVQVLRSFLVDGGATSNFVSASLVQRADLTTSRLDQSLFVRMANGALVQCERMLPSALVTVSGYSGTHTFIVMDDLDGFDAILGARSCVKLVLWSTTLPPRSCGVGNRCRGRNSGVECGLRVLEVNTCAMPSSFASCLLVATLLCRMEFFARVGLRRSRRKIALCCQKCRALSSMA